MFSRINKILLLSALLLATTAKASLSKRWTFKDNIKPDLRTIVEQYHRETGDILHAEDFILDEDRPLAFTYYQRFSQLDRGVRLKGMSLRLWSTRDKSKLIQAEIEVETAPPPPDDVARFLNRATLQASGLRDFSTLFSSKLTSSLARAALLNEDDHEMRGMKWQDYWSHGRLIREVAVKSRRGSHVITIDLMTKKVISQEYRPFETSDLELDASVYPFYEEYNGAILPRVPVKLKNLLAKIRRPSNNEDPFASMRQSRYLSSLYDATKALTPAGRALGFWSDATLRDQVAKAVQNIPYTDNDLNQGNFLLQGKFATINIHPEAFNKWQGIDFPAQNSSHFFPQWKDVTVNGEEQSELIPRASIFGKELEDSGAALNRLASRDPNHDPVRYINEGFDEVQVYYAVNQLFDSLKPLGFLDPELSTRPFHAILYDPDIAMRNNAYYTNDTINFTTYSSGEANYARDNTTIWHELGHGVMDRLMGDFLNLADTGGLSEGMADFVAALVLQDVVKGQIFPGDHDMRIINRTAFFLTNEVHDDGEAYGGSMKDILDASVSKWGQNGLHKMADLTLETMRLTRDHPHLTASDWFDHMLFADEVGHHGVREANEMHTIITAALGSRNFYKDESKRGTLVLTYDGKAIDAGKAGSRGHEIRTSLATDEKQKFAISAKVSDGKDFHFNYPVVLRAFFRTGPLQGAVHWTGEEQTFVDYTINQSGEEVNIPLEVSGTCDNVNRDDGSCSDFVYVQLFNGGQPEKSFGKKRFYIRVMPKSESKNN